MADAILKAYAGRESTGAVFRPPPKATPPTRRTSPDVWKEILNQAAAIVGKDAADLAPTPDDQDPGGLVLELIERSPVRLLDDPAHDTGLALSLLYEPDDRLFIGSRLEPGIVGRNIRTAQEWIAHFATGAPVPEQVIINPLSGTEGRTLTGSTTYRGDDCVKDYRYAVVEFDDVPRAHQAAFWLWSKLPVVAVVDSGRKSLHGWIRADCTDAAQWSQTVERGLFPTFARYGADPQCKNESRMSRTPGAIRPSTGNPQNLLFLNPQAGKAVRYE